MGNITRVFADHYQFYLYDSSFDHYSDERLSWTDGNKNEYGYLSVEKAIYVSTVAGLNDHRVRFFIEGSPTKDYERNFESIIEVPSEKLVLSAPANMDEDDFILSLSAGKYKVLICSNSVGKDMFSYEHEYDEDMDDIEYFKHDEFEYYDIFLTKIT